MDNSTHRQIQNRVLDRLLVTMGIIAIPVVASSVFRVIDTGWDNVYYMHIAAGGIVLLFAFLRKHLSYSLKTVYLVVIFFLLSASWGLSTGQCGNFVPYLMLSILVSSIFWGRKHAIIIYIACAAVIISFGFLYTRGIITTTINMAEYSAHLSSWVSNLIGFTGLTGLVILVIGDIGYILSEKISTLEKLNLELTRANNEIKTLQGILPICARCKKIRDSNGYWTQVESYISEHSKLTFSHSLCEKCSDELYGKEDWYRTDGEDI